MTSTPILPIQVDGKTLAKGALARGWAKVLALHGLMTPVLARLTPEAAALLTDPPAATEWIDVALFECIAESVRLEVGEERLTKLFVEAERTGWVVLLSRWVGPIVRVFGASPGVVLKQAEGVAKANTVGFTLRWQPVDERSGELTAHYHHRAEILSGAAWGTAAACQLAADAVDTPVRIERPRIERASDGGTLVRVRVAW